MVESVQQKPFVAVLGPSGSGKPSIVFAGLLPHLRRQGDWLMVTFRPGSDPFRNLANALLPVLEPALTETDRLIETRKMARALRQDDLDLSEVVARMMEINPQARRFLLLADQFEELYTLCPDPETRHGFVDVLLKAFLPPSNASSLVLTLRADFLSQALTYRPLADALREADVKLGPMTPDELRRAIEKPAQRQGVSFEAGLVERILADVSDEPGNLPLLEFALTALWERQTQGQLTHAAYEAVGRVEGALSCHADQVFEGLSEVEQAQARHVFVQMVRPGEGTEDTRRLTTKAELGEADWALVQKLATARLVVTDQDPDQQEIAEVVHEALIRNWGRLRAWMTEDRTFRAWQERLRAALRQWQASQQDEGALLRGAPLAEAEQWQVERDISLSQAERDFIQASLTHREEEHRVIERRRNFTIISAVVVTILMTVLGLFSFRQSQEVGRQAATATYALGETEKRGTAVAEEAAKAQAAAVAEAEARRVAEAAQLEAQREARIGRTRELAARARAEDDPTASVNLMLVGHFKSF